MLTVKDLERCITAMKSGYIEVTQEEFDALKAKIPTEYKHEVHIKDPMFSGAAALFRGVRVYIVCDHEFSVYNMEPPHKGAYMMCKKCKILRAVDPA